MIASALHVSAAAPIVASRQSGDVFERRTEQSGSCRGAVVGPRHESRLVQTPRNNLRSINLLASIEAFYPISALIHVSFAKICSYRRTSSMKGYRCPFASSNGVSVCRFVGVSLPSSGDEMSRPDALKAMRLASNWPRRRSPSRAKKLSDIGRARVIRSGTKFRATKSKASGGMT